LSVLRLKKELFSYIKYFLLVINSGMHLQKVVSGGGILHTSPPRAGIAGAEKTVHIFLWRNIFVADANALVHP